MKSSRTKKTVSFLLGVAFVGALIPSAIAYANNSADTPYRFKLTYNQCADTEWRAKYDNSSSWVNCTEYTGTAIVQSNGGQMGSIYNWGPKYPVGRGSQYIDNYVWENRPRTDVATYCFLRFTNEWVYGGLTTGGYWSPDSI